jgi:hypothetical protein
MPRTSSFPRAIAAAVVTIGVFAAGAAAQTRPALTRDVDNPALQPFRTGVFVAIPVGSANETVDAFVVPAGKRLVIETVSIWGYGPDTDEFTGVWLNVASATPAAFVLLDPNSTERRVLQGGVFVSAYTRQVRLYFAAGETIQVQVYTKGSTGFRQLNMYIHGYLVTL